MVLLTSLESFPIGKKVASALDVPLTSMISRELTVPGKDLGTFERFQSKIPYGLMMQETGVYGRGQIHFKIKNDRLEEK